MQTYLSKENMVGQQNFYDVLGVAKDASAEGIKKAYRKLVHQYHPDVSKDPDADEKTSQINLAYKTLKDPEKRAEYDEILANPFHQSNARAEGHQGYYSDADPRHYRYEFHDFSGGHFGEGQPFGSGEFRFDDIFSAFGSGQNRSHQKGPITGEDQHAELTIDVAEAYQDSERSLTLDMPTLTPDGRMTYERKTLHVKIPKGITEGQQIRLRGQGLPGINGGSNGDLYLKIRFQHSDALYVEHGKDVHQRVDITAWHAALGAKITVNTPLGALNIHVPENSRNGQQLRLKGKGIPANQPGDLLLHLNIILPAVNSEADKMAWQKN